MQSMKLFIPAAFCGLALMSSFNARADTLADREMADRYYQAASRGDDTAQFYLGALHSAGIGRPQSDTEAFQWISRAAQQGHSQAMLVLSGLCATGRGTPKDNVAGYRWAYIVASGTKIDEFRNGARQLMGVLETRMTREEVYQAKSEAERWRAIPSQAKLPLPTDTIRRDTLPQQTLPTVSGPSQPSAASEPPRSKGAEKEKKTDVDTLLDKMPSELRKRFGL